MRWKDHVAETLETEVTQVRGVVGRVLSCSFQWIRICIGWIGVVSEDAEISDPKAQEKRARKVGDSSS